MLLIVSSRLRAPPAALGVAALGVVLAGCGGSDRIGPLPVTATVTLSAEQYVVISGSEAAGAVAFPEAGAEGAQYLVVGQLASSEPDLSVTARLGGQAALVAQGPWTEQYGAPPSLRERFHGLLREREAAAAREAWRFRAEIAAAPPVRAGPPVVGEKRTFKVCGNIDCDRLSNVPATAHWVGENLAIFVDDSAPSGGFTSGDLAQLGSQFDTTLFGIAVDAFGSASDIDGNGVVIVLLTAAVNKLSPKPGCSTQFITGYSYGLDIAPGFAPQYNNGEVFYGMVPDPAGEVSCARTVTEVRSLLPVTFIHEFQHMISYNQHVLARSGTSEVLWLNEALSHLAEELAGLHYDSLDLRTTGRRFHIGNLYNAYIYLRSPAGTPVVTKAPPGSLESRGGGWLLLRWVVDQFGAGVTRQLVQTTRLGASNLEAVTGMPFGPLLGRWALAVYVGDLPEFAPAPALRYAYWRFRSTYDSLRASFPSTFTTGYPLAPATGSGVDAQITGTVASGSGHYLIVTQGAGGGGGAAFSLTFRPSSGRVFPTSYGGQMAIVRLR